MPLTFPEALRQQIEAEANAKRSEAAKQRERTDAGTFEKKPEPVVGQSVPPLDKHRTKNAKAAVAGVNAGAIARAEALAADRPDLADVESERLRQFATTGVPPGLESGAPAPV